MLDIFNEDAFSLVGMTNTVNNMDHVPGRTGELIFRGVGEGVETLTVAIEQIDSTLSLIQTTSRDEPAPKEVDDKRKMHSVTIPQVKLEGTVSVGSVQNVRAFGSENTLEGAQLVINRRLNKMMMRHDLTLEHLRLGAMRGLILDADGSTLLNLYSAFGVTPEATVDFSGALDTNTEGVYPTARVLGHQIHRTMKRNLKGMWPSGARVHAYAGDNFFDQLMSADEVTKSGTGWERAASLLGANNAFGVFEWGGIFWENYQGSDDNSTVAVDVDEAIIFPVGVPGLYAEYFAPADFLETANTIGLPRYAKIAPDGRFNRHVEIHTQQNPLPLCLKPKVLMKATINPS